jgi:hypothetical protein
MIKIRFQVLQSCTKEADKKILKQEMSIKKKQNEKNGDARSGQAGLPDYVFFYQKLQFGYIL